MTQHKIEQGIPIPKIGSGRNRSAITNTCMSLSVGESFVVANEVRPLLYARLCELKKRTGLSFTARTLEDGSIRIWRTQ